MGLAKMKLVLGVIMEVVEEAEGKEENKNNCFCFSGHFLLIQGFLS